MPPDQPESAVPLDRPVVVFDGLCNFCSGAVRFILRNDRTGRILYTPLQSTVGRKLLEEHGIDPDDADTFLLIKGNRAFTRSDAALEIARDLGPWRWLRVLAAVPRTWRDGIYAVLARKRYGWFGKRDHCFAPTPEERARFR